MYRVALVMVSTASLLAWAQPAGAATEVGQTFPPTISAGSGVLFQVNSDTSTGAGIAGVPFQPAVITSWKHHAGATPGQMKLKVMRLTNAANQVEVVGESALENTTPSTLNTFSTRIPVLGGDLIGLKTPGAMGTHKQLISSQNVVTVFSGGADPAPGSIATVVGGIDDFVVDVAATVEPDADGDGFGDESQDQCPSQAGTAGACVSLDRTAPSQDITPIKLSKLLKKRTIDIRIGSNEASTLAASGTLTIPGASKSYKLKEVKGSVAAGAKTTLKMRVAKKALRALRRKGRATSVINITATDEAGNQSRGKYTSKLRVTKTKRIIRR